jgi:hypothetical protein
VSWHRRFLISVLFLSCLFFTAETTDAIVNPKTVWSPSVGILLLVLVTAFSGLLWGDDK